LAEGDIALWKQDKQLTRENLEQSYVVARRASCVEQEGWEWRSPG
jgi:hypothetical protein